MTNLHNKTTNKKQNQNQNQNSIPFAATNTVSGINFTYSENFNKVTELSTENYTTWRTSMLHFLDINNLIKYVLTESIIKIKTNKIENQENYIIDKINPTLAYSKEIDSNKIKLDNMIKWVILNSLGNNTKKLIETRRKTAYESWKILENSFTKGKEQLYAEINEKLNSLKYDPILDINIFIANLENLFDELEFINKPLTDEAKVGIFYRSLPDNLRWINVFQFKDNWLQCQAFASKVIPGIIFSNIKEKTCNTCRKIGHSSKECYYNKYNNIKNKRNALKNKLKFNKFHKNDKNYNIKYKHKRTHALFINNKNNNNNNYDKYKNDYLNAFTQDFNSNYNNESNYIGFNKNLISICQLINDNYKVIFNSYNKKPVTIIYNPD
ncbi:hypothetical protein PIROE2DRAFT_11601, partial [Piromyces sp. E2]